MDTFDLSFYDNVKARFHDAKDSLTYRPHDLPALRSQFATYNYLYELNKQTESASKNITSKHYEH
jgi:polyphosphate kinase